MDSWFGINPHDHLDHLDLDDFADMYEHEDIAQAVDTIARRPRLDDPSPAVDALLAMRHAAVNRETSFLDEIGGSNPDAGKKPTKNAGRKFLGKTVPLKSVTSNKLHSTIFPKMRVPVFLRKYNGKIARADYGLGRGVVQARNPEDVPVMSVQCPLPGGRSVMTQTEPVQNVAWGPFARVEATGHAKLVVKELRFAAKAAMKATAKAKREKNNKDDTSDTDSNGDDANKPVTSTSHKEKVNVDGKKDQTVVQNVNVNKDITPDTASHAETDVSADSPGSRDLLSAPPPTPGEEIFRQRPTQVAASMSMPTLPLMHHIADEKLVEHYRLQHAKDPASFEQETLDLKKSLLEAKKKRGGIPLLLREEYTVELASREGAEISEKWAKGQTKTRQLYAGRSRAGSLNSQPSSGDLKMRGGEVDDGGPSTTITGTKNKEGEASEMSPTAPPASQPESAIPVLELSPSAFDDKPTPVASGSGKKKSDKANNLKKAQAKVAKLKKELLGLNMAEHVVKVSTQGTVRHQSSVKREIDDYGERRTITTWIEIQEVYEVPKGKHLTVDDVVSAIEQETNDKYNVDNADWETDTDGDSDDDVGEKEIGMAKNKGKAKKFTPNTDMSSSSDDSASDTDEVYHDENETEAEGLLRSISRLEGGVDSDRIARLAGDLNAMMAGMGVQGMLKVKEEA